MVMERRVVWHHRRYVFDLSLLSFILNFVPTDYIHFYQTSTNTGSLITTIHSFERQQKHVSLSATAKAPAMRPHIALPSFYAPTCTTSTQSFRCRHHHLNTNNSPADPSQRVMLRQHIQPGITNGTVPAMLRTQRPGPLSTTSNLHHDHQRQFLRPQCLSFDRWKNTWDQSRHTQNPRRMTRKGWTANPSFNSAMGHVRLTIHRQRKSTTVLYHNIIRHRSFTIAIDVCASADQSKAFDIPDDQQRQ